ncbi:thiazole tautomerase TenI [Sporolactobacillus sp. THM7-7]|nr:thiazole tautomerase TenI [Sporolactobacillus sp. THM7-7]
MITTGEQPLSRVLQTAKAVMPFITCLHIREKSRSEQELAVWLKTLIQAGIPREKLVLNGHPNLAARFRLGGVHLPEAEERVSQIRARYPHLKIGASVHSFHTAIDRAEQGVDYVMYGNVYETSCKPGLSGRGLDALGKIVRRAGCPVIAVGGITTNRTPAVIRSGASGVGVRSGIMLAPVPSKAAKEYVMCLKKNGETMFLEPDES